MAGTSTPRGLKAAGRRLWRSVVGDYDLDQHELALLLQACRCADRLDAMAAVKFTAHKGLRLDAAGIVFTRDYAAENYRQPAIPDRDYRYSVVLDDKADKAKVTYLDGLAETGYLGLARAPIGGEDLADDEGQAEDQAAG